MATQDELKRIAAEKAVEFVPENEYIGIGTGSTINFFIEALGKSGKKIKGAVSTSKKSSELLAKYEIPEVSLNEVMGLAVYVDGADEVNHALQMIKGGGGAHLNEKIVASASDKFVCIADESKYVSRLGKFPLPVEVVENARSLVSRKLLAMGGQPELRVGYTTFYGNQIVDVYGLKYHQALKWKMKSIKLPAYSKTVFLPAMPPMCWFGYGRRRKSHPALSGLMKINQS